MRSPRRFRRAGWLLAVLIQVLAPALASVADARLEAESVAATTHVESREYPCGSVGHPAACALCQFLRTGAVEPAAGGFAPAPAPDSRCAAAPPTVAASFRGAASPLPRAPPALS